MLVVKWSLKINNRVHSFISQLMERLKQHVCHTKGRWSKAEERQKDQEVDEMALCLYECLRAVGLQQHYDTFTSMGVHRAAHLSELTMEDYPILGISTMEDRTRLFHLVQMVKSLDLENLDYNTGTDGDHSAAEHYTESSGKCYDDYGEPLEDVYDEDEDEKGAAMNKTDTVTFSKPSSIRRRLDFTSEIIDHQQQQFSGPVDTGQVCASYDRIRASVHSHMQHNSETRNTVVYGCRGNTHRVNVHSCSSDNHHAGGITKPGITRGASMLNSCTKSSPKCGSFQKPTTRSVTMTPRRITNKRSGHKENVSPQRKGIFNKTKLQTVIGLNESSKWFPKTIPVYKAMTPSGYNYGLPQSSIPTPNKRLAGDQRISVCVRKRPLTHVEKRRREADVVTTPGGECVIVHESKEAVDLSQYILQHRFYFDQVFGEENSNDEVYQRTAYPLVHHMLNGGRATCFAYGQTGAGKTHTMLGSSPGKLGLYALAAQDIFSYISTTRSHSHLTVYISFFEIYCGHLYDLLDDRKRLFAREDGQKMVHIAGLCHIRVDSVNSLLEVISQGTEERTQGMSGVNPLSSRSHALLQIQLRDPNQQTFGRMWFVDLAGSERASDSKEPDKQSRMEGAEINQSLLALKECIRSLDQEQSHTPFRQSKLTQVLKDSFVGDSMTCMIANISPCNSATEHTLNTLRYADRVKELKGLGGHRRGRRGKTTPCPKYNLSNSNSTFGGSSVGTRGRSPPKKPKLQREAFGPPTPTMRLPKGGTFLCSTPRNNRWGEETNVREKNGNVFDKITPIRCSLGSGDKRQRGEGEHKSDTERWSKVDRHSFCDQNTNAGLALRQPKDGQPFLWEVQRNRVADEGNFCLGLRHSGFCNREEEKQQGISTEQGKEMEMKCREQTGRVESIKDTCDDVERMREDLQVNERKKEREKHLRLYHQQLQQFVPSPVSVSSSNQPSLTSSPSSSSNVSASPLRHDHLEEVLDVYRARVEVRAHSNRGLLPFPSEQVCVQTETFPSHNLNNDEEGHRGSVSIDAEWKATEATFRQTEDRSGSEKRTPLEVKWEREARVRRPVQIVQGEKKWAWVATTQSEQAHRMPGAMMNDVEALMSNSCDSEEIRLGRQEEVDASADGVWSVEDAEESDGLGSTCSNSDDISVFNHPPAESASQRAPAERPLSPGCEHNNTLLTLSSLNHSPGSKQSRCSSKILPLLNTLKGAPSHSCEQKELNLGVNASKMEFTSLPLTTSIKHDGCTEPFNTLPENLSYIQIHNRQESKAKMSVLPQEESFAGFLNDSMDPLSISMLQVDQQAATNSFLRGKESIHSLCPPDMEGGEGDGRGMEKEHFTCEKTRGKVEEDKDIKFHMSLLKKICSSATSADRLGMMKSSIPVSCVAQPTTEPLDITASAPPLKSTRHTSLQTSAIQSNSPSVHYPGSHYVITHSATQMPPQYAHNIHRESTSSISATQTDSIQDNSNTMPNQRHSVHSGYARETNKLPQLTSPRQPNNKGEGRTNQQLTSKTNLEDLDEAQWCVVQAHWEQLKEMEALSHKEGTLLCQQPDMTFAEYINQLELIMERKAKCVHSMIAQLQPYVKFSPSSHQQHKQEDDHNLTT